MEPQTGTDQPLRFGSFELDVRSRELHNGTSRVRLQEQPFEILRMMLERPGDVVTRDELQQRLWPDGTFVDFEHSINAAVKRLREALGDDADNPRFVETLPRRGYRFIAALRTAPGGPGEGPPPKVRLAVLPFSNLSEERGQDYFADGLTEEMITQLGHLCRGRIGVISRSSSMVFKESGRAAGEIGRALRADYLLEGSIRREGDRVRITARLVETAGETHLWVESYEASPDRLPVGAERRGRANRQLADDGVDPRPAGCFTRRIEQRVGIPGLPEGPLLLEHGGRSRASTRRSPISIWRYGSIQRLRRRTRPCRVCVILRAEYYGTQPRKALEAARQSAKRALDLDPTLSEAHLALGDVRRMLEWDWRGAEAAYSQAIVLNPSHEGAHRGYGLLLAALGRPAEAIRESERASEMDPLCVVVNAEWGSLGPISDRRLRRGDFALASRGRNGTALPGGTSHPGCRIPSLGSRGRSRRCSSKGPLSGRRRPDSDGRARTRQGGHRESRWRRRPRDPADAV